MKKNTRLQNFGLVLAGAVSASLLWHAFGAAGAASNADTYKQLNLFGDVFERIRSQYVEEPENGKLMEAAINGMLTSLDPHSSYLPPEDFDDMQVQTRGEFGGLGIEVTQEEGYVKVVSPMDGTPAGVCNAQAASWAIGRAPTQDVVDRATRDSGAKVSRVLRPGQVVTMEYLADRLNIDVNEREAITGLRCG